MDDELLIKNIQKGGFLAEQGFIQLDKALRPIMYMELNKTFNTLSYAKHEEVIQETFIKVFTQLRDDKFQGRSSLKNWIMAILKHMAIDAIRKHNKSPQGAQISDNTRLDNLKNKQEQTEKSNDECLEKAINAYHKEDADALSDLLLVSTKGINAKQLAEIRGITHGTARERLRRYRKKLMGYYDEILQEA
jgi:RNA polymerase sigma-70 factor (ECF subfamily)